MTRLFSALAAFFFFMTPGPSSAAALKQLQTLRGGPLVVTEGQSHFNSACFVDDAGIVVVRVVPTFGGILWPLRGVAVVRRFSATGAAVYTKTYSLVRGVRRNGAALELQTSAYTLIVDPMTGEILSQQPPVAFPSPLLPLPQTVVLDGDLEAALDRPSSPNGSVLITRLGGGAPSTFSLATDRSPLCLAKHPDNRRVYVALSPQNGVLTSEPELRLVEPLPYSEAWRTAISNSAGSQFGQIVAAEQGPDGTRAVLVRASENTFAPSELHQFNFGSSPIVTSGFDYQVRLRAAGPVWGLLRTSVDARSFVLTRGSQTVWQSSNVGVSRPLLGDDGVVWDAFTYTIDDANGNPIERRASLLTTNAAGAQSIVADFTTAMRGAGSNLVQLVNGEILVVIGDGLYAFDAGSYTRRDTFPPDCAMDRLRIGEHGILAMGRECVARLTATGNVLWTASHPMSAITEELDGFINSAGVSIVFARVSSFPTIIIRRDSYGVGGQLLSSQVISEPLQWMNFSNQRAPIAAIVGAAANLSMAQIRQDGSIRAIPMPTPDNVTLTAAQIVKLGSDRNGVGHLFANAQDISTGFGVIWSQDLNPTPVEVTLNANPTRVGVNSPTQFTASVRGDSPSGNLTIRFGPTSCSVAIGGSCTLAEVTAGPASATATFSGDVDNLSGVSQPIQIQVEGAADLATQLSAPYFLPSGTQDVPLTITYRNEVGDRTRGVIASALLPEGAQVTAVQCAAPPTSNCNALVGVAIDRTIALAPGDSAVLSARVQLAPLSGDESPLRFTARIAPPIGVSDSRLANNVFEVEVRRGLFASGFD